MFQKKKKIIKCSYDREHLTPVIRCSICNGEQVAGFKDIRSGKFQDIMLIRSEKDLQEFKDRYDLSGNIPKEY